MHSYLYTNKSTHARTQEMNFVRFLHLHLGECKREQQDGDDGVAGIFT